MASKPEKYSDPDKYLKLSQKMSDTAICNRYGVSRNTLLMWKRKNALVKGGNKSETRTG